MMPLPHPFFTIIYTVYITRKIHVNVFYNPTSEAQKGYTGI